MLKSKNFENQDDDESSLIRNKIFSDNNINSNPKERIYSLICFISNILMLLTSMLITGYENSQILYKKEICLRCGIIYMSIDHPIIFKVKKYLFNFLYLRLGRRNN